MERTAKPRATRRPGAWLAARPAVLAVAGAAVLLLLVSPNWKMDPDSGSYLSMARSLAGGHGMRRLGLRQWYFAPLYPVWISPTFRFSARPFLLISLVNVVTAWAMVGGTYAWFGRYSRRGAGFVAALVAVNVGLWDVCREPRADTLFSALVIWAAVFLARAADARGARSFGLHAAVGAALVVAACLTREVGIFLTAGFTVALMIRWAYGRGSLARALTGVAVGVLASAVVLLLVARDRHAGALDGPAIGGGVTYLDQYRQADASLAAQLLDGFRRQTADVGRLLLPGLWGSFAHQGQWLNVNTVVYVLFTVPVAVGWWRLARRTADPLLWTVPFYAAMFVVWPFDQGTRFNVPMLPVLWASAWAMLGRWPRRRVAVFAVVLALHVVVSVGYLAHDAAAVGRANRAFGPMADLVARVTPGEPVATLDVPSADVRVGIYLLDRPILRLRRGDPVVPADVRWLLTGSASTALPGFSPVATAGGVHLFQRLR